MDDPSQDGRVEDNNLHRFPCPACGGEVRFDPAEQAMRCTHCDTLSPLPAAEGIIEELGLGDARRQGVGKGMGVARRSLQCESCGAITSFDDVRKAVKCAFCDSHHVVQQVEDDPQIISPASLVPFKIVEKEALSRFEAWVKSLWFKPNDLGKTMRLKEIRGVYVPFWTFDAQTNSTWHAMAGYHYYVTETYTEMVDGKPEQRTRQVQKTRWRPASGHDSHFFDDELVCASKGLRAGMVRRIFPFRTEALEVYQPPFLAGWEAERYQIDLEEGWTIGRRLMDAEIRRRCAAKVPGDTHKNLTVSSQFSGVSFKHVLLPIWVAAYHYKDKLYQFLVNGQTGTVAGDSPKSWVKITLLVLTIALFVGGIIYWHQTTQ